MKVARPVAPLRNGPGVQGLAAGGGGGGKKPVGGGMGELFFSSFFSPFPGERRGTRRDRADFPFFFGGFG